MIADNSRLNGEDRALLEDARRLAATLGNFEPLALMKQIGVNQSAREAGPARQLGAILDLLSRDCDEVQEVDKIFWRLQPAARKSILENLRESGKLEQIASAAQPLASDAFGTLLSALSAGESAEVAQAKSADPNILGSLDSALHYLGREEDRRRVQAEIQRDETEQAFHFILPGDLIGRDEELRKLDAFIYDAGADVDAKPKFFLVKGSGGAGKSALLAELARRELQRGDDATPVIWLDLDRPLLASTDPVALMLEFARQLALFWPDQRAGLDQFRSEVSYLSGAEAENDYQRETLLSTAFSIWRESVYDILPVQQPIVIIVDTFEEVLLHGRWNADRIERFLLGLASEAGLYNLRPVLSGRAFDKAWREAIAPRVVGEITLEGLPPRAAEALLGIFLTYRGAAPRQFALDRLVEQFGGNPLVLKILAQYLADEGLAAQRDLLEGQGVGGLRDELAQQYLYTRILSRIRTESADLVKLAFPGLALRRITADLITKVLAGPCGIAASKRADAEALLGDLSRQIWLVEPDDDPMVVRHRRDLRRLMLKAIPPAKQAIVCDIHRRAADYYRTGQDPVLPEYSQLIEWQYHSAMAGELVTRLDDGEAARQFLDALGEDAETLPTKILAHLKFAADRLLAAEETASLDEERKAATEDKAALTSIRAGYQPEFASGWESSSVDVHAADAFVSGNWEQLLSMADAAFTADFIDARRTASPNFTECASWRVAMAAIAAGRRLHCADRFRTFVTTPGISAEIRTPFAGNKSAATRAEVLLSLAHLLDVRIEDYLRLSVRPRQDIVKTTDDLRLAQLSRRAHERQPLSVNLGLLRTCRTGTVDWLGREAHVSANQFAAWQSSVKAQPHPSLSLLLSITREGFIQTSETWTTRFSEHGLLRELYPAIERCAHQVDAEVLIEAANNISEKAYAWPHELSGRALFANIERDPKRWISTLVEITDRAGELDRLVRSMTPYVASAQNVLVLIKGYSDRLATAEMDPHF